MTTQNTQEELTDTQTAETTIAEPTNTAPRQSTLQADLAGTFGIHDLTTFNSSDLSAMSAEVKQALFLSLIPQKDMTVAANMAQAPHRFVRFPKVLFQRNSKNFIPLKNSPNSTSSGERNVTSKAE